MRWAAGASRDGLRVSQPRVTALGLITLPADASPAFGSAAPVGARRERLLLRTQD